MKKSDEGKLAVALMDHFHLSATFNGKNLAAMALGYAGGRRGGLARALKLSPERRKEIAQKAARTRWAKV